MGRRAMPGVYVKSLFKVSRILGVPQRTVAQHLGVQPSAVSMWATGARPIPRRHYPRFYQFISAMLARGLHSLHGSCGLPTGLRFPKRTHRASATEPRSYLAAGWSRGPCATSISKRLCAKCLRVG